MQIAGSASGEFRLGTNDEAGKLIELEIGR